jgi:hypothetical protein
MFKLICKVGVVDAKTIKSSSPRDKLAPAAKKYNKVIDFNDCVPCDVGGLKLTSSGENPSRKEALELVKFWNTNFLNPYNPNYYEAYSNILEKVAASNFNLRNFRFVGLFEKDPGLGYRIPIEGLQFSQAFETIINLNEPSSGSAPGESPFKTGYKAYHAKGNWIEFTNSTGNTFPTYEVLSKDPIINKDITLHEVAAAYLVRHKGTMTCIKIQDTKNSKAHTKYSSDNLDDYMKFLEQAVIKQLHSGLATHKQCYVGVDHEIPIASPKGKSQDEIRTLCESQEGKFKSMKTMLDEICQNPDSILMNWRSAFSITCDNYNDILTFNKNGEIVVPGSIAPHNDEL